MRALKKILALPVFLVLIVAVGLLHVALKCGSWVGGIYFGFMGLCTVLALITEQWLNLRIFIVMIGCGAGVFIGATTILAFAEIARDDVKEFMVS